MKSPNLPCLKSFLLLFSIAFNFSGLAQQEKVKGLDTVAIVRITGVRGVFNNGEYKITISQATQDLFSSLLGCWQG